MRRSNSFIAWLLAAQLVRGIPAFATMTAADLDVRSEQIRRRHHIPGAVLLVVSPTAIVHTAAFGEASRSTHRPISLDDYFRVGSITKTFTALGVMTLVERGKLRLDTPVPDLVTRLPYHHSWERQYPVQVAQLLEHTAGFYDLSRKEFDFNEPLSLAAAFALDPDSREIHWPPGMHASYSNSGAGIAALVIERTSGLSYEEFMRRHVFTPLAMHSATLVPEPRMLATPSSAAMTATV